MGVVADGVCGVFFVAALSVCGGVFNHMRGSNGGMLSADAFAESCADNECAGYWLKHIYTRALMALPTGALIYLINQRSTLAAGATFLMFSSIFLGWGSYFALGFNENAYLSRSGFVDWLVGRQEAHWDWTRRWIHDYGAMGIRGLAWTMPAGHIMYHAGYSWQFALSGALMPAIYTLGNWPHPMWTADGWEPQTCHDPPFQVDWAFTNPSEFLFGFWHWITLLAALLRYAQPLRRGGKRSRAEWAFEGLCGFVCFIFLGSVVFYATVKQDDKENWGQSLYGIAVSAVGLLISLFVALRRSRRSGSYAVDAYAVNAADDSSEADERRPLLGMGSTPEWARRSSPAAENVVFKWLERLLGVLTLISLAMTLIFVVTAAGWNVRSPRYMPSD